MSYAKVVEEAQKEISGRKQNVADKLILTACDTWKKGDQINLWTYWQGFQLDDIDEKGVDILLAGQDWGNPDRGKAKELCGRIKQLQSGNVGFAYIKEGASATDRNLAELFEIFDCDIYSRNPSKRLFFTNYVLGYRTGDQFESGGMTEALMLRDKELFDQLVLAIKPKIIICLGKITFEAVSGSKASDFIKTLQSGKPHKAYFPEDKSIPVYGVAHCGAWGKRNVGGMEKMKENWRFIAEEYSDKYGTE